MTYKIPYEKFHTKLKDLWESCGDQFPPRIIEDTLVYLNGKTSSIILRCKKHEYLEIETENDEAKKVVESGKYIVTYGRWFDDTHFSYIILPIDEHMKSLDLISQRIQRQNIKIMLPRLGIYGLDYAIRDIAHNTDILNKLYLYKDHETSITEHSSQIPTDYSKRIGYIISIDDDDVEVLIDRNYLFKIEKSLFIKNPRPFIRFVLNTDVIAGGKKRIKDIIRIEVVKRGDDWTCNYANKVIFTAQKDINPNIQKEFEG